MPSGFDIKLLGNKEVLRALNGLNEQVRKRILGTAAHKAMEPALKGAKARLHSNSDRTGMLAKSLIRKRKNYANGSIAWVGIGPASDAVLMDTEFGKIVPSNYAHLIEFGTQRMAARPFLRPALDANKGRMLNIVSAKVRSGIGSYLKRVAKRV